MRGIARNATLTLGLTSLLLTPFVALVAPRPARADSTAFAVSVWADATGIGDSIKTAPAHNPDSSGNPGDGTSIVSAANIFGADHTIVFGPGNQNLFLVQGGEVFSTTGPSGGVPGTFTDLGSLPDSGTNEGSAFLSMGGTQILFVGDESNAELFGAAVTGSGSSVALGSVATYDGEQGDESASPGAPGEFDDAEGVALLNGTPRFNDSHATPLFASAAPGNTLMVNGHTFPIVDANWSGKTLLVVDEDENNVIAMLVHNDGTLVNPGVALADASTGVFSSGDPDPIALSGDGRFAFVQNERHSQFFSFDLQNLDSSGGTGHIQEFDFTAQTWGEGGLAVLGGFLYAVAQSPNASGVTALFRMVIGSGGQLGAPAFATNIEDPQGDVATSTDDRLTTDGTCLYASDPGSSFVFQICPGAGRSVPALDGFGLFVTGACLLAAGAWLTRRVRAAA